MPDARAIRAFLDDEHISLAARVGEFCAENIREMPAAEDDDSARVQARVILGRLGEGGWLR